MQSSSWFKSKWCEPVLVASYLMAAITANLLVWWFGQRALVVTAVVLLPFDFLARDMLHHRWSECDGHGRLWARMCALIIGGSILTFMCNPTAGCVALASSVSFLAAGMIDVVTYELLQRRSRGVRMNASNATAAVLDSIVFPMIAFGGLNGWLSLSQALLKFAGGFALTAAFLRTQKDEVCRL